MQHTNTFLCPYNKLDWKYFSFLSHSFVWAGFFQFFLSVRFNRSFSILIFLCLFMNEMFSKWNIVCIAFIFVEIFFMKETLHVASQGETYFEVKRSIHVAQLKTYTLGDPRAKLLHFWDLFRWHIWSAH